VQGNVQIVGLRENHAALDEVFKLANVAWPLSVHECIHRLSRNKPDALLHLAGSAQNKIVHEQRHVFTSITKWRDLDWENIQSVKQVFAKLVVADHAVQVAVRCSNQAHIDMCGSCASQTFKFPLLKRTQQLWLQVEADVADFVQKETAAIG